MRVNTNIKERQEGGGSKVNVEREKDEMMSKAGAKREVMRNNSQQH